MRNPFLLFSVLTVIGSCTAPHLEPRKAKVQAPLPALGELDSWLAAREASVPGIKTGVEAGIVWADPQKKAKTKISLVYLPGYTATRGEISPVAERIAHEMGANLFFARPTGQGVGPDGHRTVKASDWVADGLEALEIGQILGERVVVVATSTGGTLAVWLTLGPAARLPAATILISPNLTPKNARSEMLLWPGSGWLLSWMLGDTVSVEPRNDAQARFWDTTHHSHSLIPMMQLVEGARRQDFGRWPTPVLVVYDPLDKVVDETVTVKLFSRAPREKVSLVEWHAAEADDHHVLAGDALSPGGTERMVELGVDFLKRTLGG